MDPQLPDERSPVNLFGGPEDGVVSRCFELKRLRLIGCTDEPPEVTP
ncbi:hypothetical protein [Streptomyces blattellae]|nr:hypothetical protein [Streptomyces blattellae]